MSDSPPRAPLPDDLASRQWFFCGIGGSGMLPLASILKARGASVAGSDRSFDQGRSPDKFAWLERAGFALYPQDGSGITDPAQILVASAAVEDSVPEMVRARELGCSRVTRAELNAHLFNRAEQPIAIGGTSGKSTVTGMLGWIMAHAGRDPTIMNGAVMKNFASSDAPFASARVGRGGAFVSEVDESDGSIALYRPNIAVLTNVSLDHKSLEELRGLFSAYLERARSTVINLDDEESRRFVDRSSASLTFGIEAKDAMFGIEPGTIVEEATGIAALLVDRREDRGHSLRLAIPGRHNLANALAAVAAAVAAGVTVHDATMALADFAGLARRFDIVGTSPSGVTVIDDFAHNPDKIRATLATLRATPGRITALFQPHGYGPLRQMGKELADTFAQALAPDDRAMLTDPVYFGGTVDRSEGAERIVALIRSAGGVHAEHIADRAAAAKLIARTAEPGERVIVMGARDDTLSDFARSIFDMLA